MNDPCTLIEGDVLDVLRDMQTESVHCVICSPPYWGLRDYGVEGMIGLEPTLDEHIAKLVEVFREVRRVLRSDGTFWLNYGDAYQTSPAGNRPGCRSTRSLTNPKRQEPVNSAQRGNSGLAPKQRLLMPARVALALQDDGWWIRSEIVWAKGVSFCPTYSGSCMPSSVKDRPTDSHEMLYLLTKRPRYFYDGEAVREAAKYGRREWTDTEANLAGVGIDGKRGGGTVKGGDPSAGRNLRTVWTIGTQAYSKAHFATFPERLIEPCVLAGTSERGACSECGAPWRRIVERGTADVESQQACGGNAQGEYSGIATKDYASALAEDPSEVKARILARMRTRRTTGWEPTCDCSDARTVPCTVLDPFCGSGTVGVVALRHGRTFIGIDLSEDYLNMAEERISAEEFALDMQHLLAWDGKRFLVDGERTTQKALGGQLKKLGVSGRRFRMMLDAAKARAAG